SFLGDTWTFYNGEWTAWTPSLSPSPRFGAAVAYDPLNDNVYLFGGCGVTCPLSDTWVYHQAGPATVGTWTELFPPISPPGVYFATLTFDPAVSGLVLFGGCEGGLGSCPAQETWTLTGSGTWNDLALAPSDSPPARFGAAATFVPNSRLVLFGGMGSSGLLTDTWTYGVLTGVSASPVGLGPSAGPRVGWQAVVTVTTPPGRVFGTLAYVGANDALLLSGGCGSVGCPSLAPWYYTLVTPKPPPPGQPPPPTTGPWFAVDRPPPWVWNGEPSPGYGTATVWDPEGGPNGFVLGVGGRDATGETMTQSFEYAGTAWYGLDAVS
ncbi:MAG TPA: kelch repeat-containing protein, partial [Thermoplasmata archaeon]|nr:kelch repeat-containing protein [Thermoplasmata archaeon]